MSEEECFHKLEQARSLLLELPDIHARVNGAQWLRRLSGPEPGAGGGSSVDLTLRTRYLQLLLASLRRGRLLGPFAKPPPCGGLDPLPAEESVERLTGHWEKKKSAIRGPPPVASESSAGGREYAAAQLVPGFGVQCYLAVAPPSPPSSPSPAGTLSSRGRLSGTCAVGGGASVDHSAGVFASGSGPLGTGNGCVGKSTTGKVTGVAMRRLSGVAMEGSLHPPAVAIAGVEETVSAPVNITSSSLEKTDEKEDSILNIVKQMRQREAERRARAEAASWGTYAHSSATPSLTVPTSNMASSLSGYGDGTHYPAFDRWGRPERDM